MFVASLIPKITTFPFSLRETWWNVHRSWRNILASVGVCSQLETHSESQEEG